MADLEAAVDTAVTLAQAQAKAIQALPAAINAVAEAANNINATANEARAVIRKAQAVTDRLDEMLNHVEPAVSELTPTLQALKEAQQRIVAMTGSTEKMASFVEDAGAGLSRLAGISGATNLFNRLASAATGAGAEGQRGVGVRSQPAGALSAAAEILDAEIHDGEIVEDEERPVAVEDLSPAMAALTGWVTKDTSAGEVNPAAADLADTEVADAELADAELAERQLREATDAALQPVELGSEADGPDLDVADDADEAGHATG